MCNLFTFCKVRNKKERKWKSSTSEENVKGFFLSWELFISNCIWKKRFFSIFKKYRDFAVDTVVVIVAVVVIVVAVDVVVK